MNKSSNYDDSQGTPYMYSHNGASGSFDPENIETGHTVSSDRETGIEFVREIIPQPAGQAGAEGPLPPTEIIIVGTAHVSEKSVREVNDTISRVKPDIVAVELCRARYESIKGNVQNAQIPVKELLKGGKIYFYIVHMLLAHIQKKFADQMGIQPGAEMIGAIEAAEASGAQVLLIDRNVQVTLQRFWSKMGFIEKIKMMGGLIAAVLGIGGTKDIDMDTITNQDIVSVLVEEFRGTSPNAVKVLIDERDAYMARNLLRAAGTGGKKIVAVVGAGHRAGIQRYLEDPASLPKVEYDIEAPRKRFSLAKLFGFAIVGIAIATFILLLLSGVPFETMMVAFAWWFIINGVLSAAGALLARGHPYSVLTAFSVAWLTSLNPMMAAGWFAGLTEAKYRNPTTDDFKTLIDADSTSEMMSNNLFRVILVAALANLGSMAGTFLGVYVMLEVTGVNPQEVIKAGISAGMAALGLG